MVDRSPFTRLLVANRGEIACRVLRAAAELGIETVAVAPADDAASLHLAKADVAVELEGRGGAAYLDIEQLVAVAIEHGCDAVHPGYGFLSENELFATACEGAGITFVGPTPTTLALFGDKSRARQLATDVGVPVLAGTSVLAGADEAAAFVAEHGGAMLKAVAGGGGRGMRRVVAADDAAAAFERCQSEASAAFGSGAVYAEQLVLDARHIEVQVIGDGTGKVTHLWERECSLQRQNQKIVELAPAPGLDAAVRTGLLDAAISLAAATEYRSLGTFEFLVDRSSGSFFFIEANARLQVEHTVTEEVTGIDLVQSQLLLAGGATLDDLGLADSPPAVGQAVQLRINTEVMQPDGSAKPSGGTLTQFDIPSGLGIRTDTYGYAGYTTSPSFDSLLAKVIATTRTGGLAAALSRAGRALEEFRIEGVATNAGFLGALIAHPSVIANDVSTGFIAANAQELIDSIPANERVAEAAAPSLAGTRVDASDPLAVLSLGKEAVAAKPSSTPPEAIDGQAAVNAPMQGTIVSVDVAEGDEVVIGTQLLVMEAMKMEHVITADVSGVVRGIKVSAGDAIFEGHQLVIVEEADVQRSGDVAEHIVDLDVIRPDLAEAIARHGFGFDQNRPEAVAKRHATGRRTARENIAHLTDGDSFIEWGPLVVAAQRKRRTLDELIEKTPGDGLIGGVGSINGDLFDEDKAQAMVVTYDYMVLAGTQGANNHRKKDRVFELAAKLRTPVVMFAEGGGGRPGDTDGLVVAGLDCLAFSLWGELSGLVPLVGINGGYCFAGNAALLGCCDVIIATKDSNLGMGGPAMIEGGGLGVFRPTEVGPVEDQVSNGVIDILVEDEAEAVEVAKKYLSYFQGTIADWEIHDQRRLRHIIPENRLRMYDVREVIETMFDVGSVLEIRKDFGLGMITSFARIEGRPVGIVANNPVHLSGAIDSDGADKAARFMQLCDAFDIPLVNFCDTPGIMVGPEVEKTALVRHAARMFVTGANVDVPMVTIVLRKGYGLGAQAMAGGGFKMPIFTVAWPTGEFGGMGLEGAVKLGYRNELAAIEDPTERLDEFEKRVARMYEMGKGVSVADHFEIDDVIDPIESRRWIMMALKSAPPPPHREGKKRAQVDTW
ncbi:MAG: acetyl/propionyl-CoA carboxylase alpha subunit [Acidimicrobiales bacterium]|jgi:acetyl/propionyl-CoA carboxylase alpha subunit